jgi:serine protease
MSKLRIVAAASLVGAVALGVSAITLADRDRAHDAATAPAVEAPTSFPADLVTESGDDELAGEIAVDLRDDVSADDVADLDRKYGVVLRADSAWGATHDKIDIADVDVANEDSILAKLSSDPRVESAERMALVRASFVPNDPLYESKQWNLKRVGAETAWDYTCGRGVTVAVIDTGVACFDKGPFSRGSDLSGTRCTAGYNFVDNTPDAYDDHGHGTHVAGTIAQTTNNGVGAAGLAYCATLMPVKVLSKQGFGTVAGVAEGIRFAADNGADVINMSLGGPVASRAIANAVKFAIGKGVVVVAAAGNSGRSVGYPAAYPGVIAVSATDSSDKIAWFSSRGPEVTIGAPGVGITQQTVCDGGKNKCELFGTFNGTSMASPHVAGVVAMIESMGVTSPAAVRAELASTATPKDDAKLYGAGILNGGAAVSDAHWSHVKLRVGALALLALLVARRIRKRGGAMTGSPLALFGALVGGVGLLPFLPLTGLVARAASWRMAAELAMRPLGEWDLSWGAGSHRWLLLASAIPVVVGTMFFFGHKSLRFVVGGLALGTAALCAQLAFSGDVAFVGGPFLMRVWMVVSTLVALWIARIGLDVKRA